MSDLYSKTIELIRSSGKPINQIAKEAGVGQRWLHDLADHRFSDPGVKKIERLYLYLTNENSLVDRREVSDRRTNRRGASK
jgi:hypothetical protein